MHLTRGCDERKRPIRGPWIRNDRYYAQLTLEALTNTKQGTDKDRWLRVAKDRALAPLLPKVIIETQGGISLARPAIGHGVHQRLFTPVA